MQRRCSVEGFLAGPVAAGREGIAEPLPEQDLRGADAGLHPAIERFLEHGVAGQVGVRKRDQSLRFGALHDFRTCRIGITQEPTIWLHPCQKTVACSRFLPGFWRGQSHSNMHLRYP